MSKQIRNLILIWGVYIVVVNLFVVALGFFGLLSLKIFSLKEFLFAVWGYGWDGMHYLKIAQQGYHFPLQAFFPLYPLLIKFFNIVLPLTLSYRINVFLVLVVIFLFYFNICSIHKYKAIIGFLAFPTAFFLQANYTETLYILISCGVIYFLSKQKYWLASLLGILLTATKISGVAICVVILISYLLQYKLTLKSFMIAAFYSVIPLFGVGLYFIYLQNAFGSFEIFFKSQSEWQRSLQYINASGYFYPIYKAVVAGDVSFYRRLMEVFAFMFSVFMLWKSWKRINLTLWVFCLIHFLIFISTGSFLSLNRLVLLMFPLILFIPNVLKSKWVFNFYVVISVIFQLITIYLFFNNVFVG